MLGVRFEVILRTQFHAGNLTIAKQLNAGQEEAQKIQLRQLLLRKQLLNNFIRFNRRTLQQKFRAIKCTRTYITVREISRVGQQSRIQSSISISQVEE